MTDREDHDSQPDTLGLVPALKALIGRALVPPEFAGPRHIAQVKPLLILACVGGPPLPPQSDLSPRIHAVRDLLTEFVNELLDWPPSQLPPDFTYSDHLTGPDIHQEEMALLADATALIFQLNLPSPKPVTSKALQTAANALYKKPPPPRVRWFERARQDKYLLPWIADWLIERESTNGPHQASSMSTAVPLDSPTHVAHEARLVDNFLRAAEHYLRCMSIYFSPRLHSVDFQDALYAYGQLVEASFRLEERSQLEIEPRSGMSARDAEDFVTFSRLAADYWADDDSEVGPFSLRERRLLEYRVRTTKAEPVLFQVFVEDTTRGSAMLDKWRGWLESCTCPADEIVEPSSVKCRVHHQMDLCLLCLRLCNWETFQDVDWRVELREAIDGTLPMQRRLL